MKKFLKNCSKLLVLFLLINLILLLIVTPGYYLPYEKYKPDFSTYILSDSHGLAINDYAEEFGIYNFSAASDSYSDMLRKLNYLISNNKKVDQIILTIDDHVLTPYRDKHNNNDRSIVYESPSELFSNYSNFKEWLQRYVVLLNPKARDYLASFFKSEVKKIIQKNDSNKNQLWSEMDLSSRQKIALERYNLQFNYQTSSETMKAYFKKIIYLCEKNDISVVGIRYPLSKVYLDLVDRNDEEIESLIDELNIKVIDFKYAFKNNSDYFFNQDHLNRKGGKALSILIHEALLAN